MKFVRGISLAVVLLCVLPLSAAACSSGRFEAVSADVRREVVLDGVVSPLAGDVRRVVGVVRRATEHLSVEVFDDADGSFERPFFVGNSLVEGMRLNSDDGFDFWCEVGISLDSLSRKLVIPEGFDCVVVEMGSNELGLWSYENFTSAYGKLLARFDVPCFCLSIPPVNEGKSKYAVRVNNENVATYNEWIRDVCEETGATFVDCGSFFGTELRSDWTGDGLHLKPSVYSDWYTWVLDAAGVRV